MSRFTSPPNIQAYYAQVWVLVRRIPPGKVASYGQIALMLPPPPGVDFESYRVFGPRWVGGALAACPDDVPWQRVINAQGKISPRPGAQKQRQMLEQEGVCFDTKERVDLKVFGWDGTD
jgi:methylated-DNA-protein-cysteine methyltransferase-like protein